jgi:uncharacterized membrane protein YeaQ/YmgE (transglycosylase-associated protein family)
LRKGRRPPAASGAEAAEADPGVTSVDVELGLTFLAAMLSPTTLTFSVLALVLSDRPSRTGLWFFLGAFGVTMIIGVIAAFALGSAVASPGNSSEPKTWVAIVDVVAGVLLLVWVVRTLRRPRDPKRLADAMQKMSKVSSSPAIAIVGAGATLANPGGFIPLALKDISQLKPSTGGFIALWLAFAVVSLLPLLAALIALAVSRDWTVAKLQSARSWLERNARTMAAVIVVLLAAALLRNGIVGLTT